MPDRRPASAVVRDLLARSLARSRADGWGELLFVPVLLLAVGAYLTLTNEFFLTQNNLSNLLVQASILAIVAFGATFVLIARELDLSVGSGVALTSVVAALVMRDTGSILLGVLACMATGVAIGAVNGLVVTKLEVPSFVATFGMLTIAHGLALALTQGGVVAGLPPDIGVLTRESFLGVRDAIWLTAGVFAVLLYVQTQTPFGVRVFAVGGNRAAAHLAGMSIDRVRAACFVISGVTMGIGGLVLTSRLLSGQPNGGVLLELDVIAAIVIGGTSILGGRGSVARTLWGVLFIATLQNGLDLEGVGDDLKRIIIGTVLVLAATVEFVRRHIRTRAQRAPMADAAG